MPHAVAPSVRHRFVRSTYEQAFLRLGRGQTVLCGMELLTKLGQRQYGDVCVKPARRERRGVEVLRPCKYTHHDIFYLAAYNPYDGPRVTVLSLNPLSAISMPLCVLEDDIAGRTTSPERAYPSCGGSSNHPSVLISSRRCGLCWFTDE